MSTTNKELTFNVFNEKDRALQYLIRYDSDNSLSRNKVWCYIQKSKNRTFYRSTINKFVLVGGETH